MPRATLAVVLAGVLWPSMTSGVWAQSVDLAPPTELVQLGPVVSWVDNATDEDGYRVEVRLSSLSGQPNKTFAYEVAADVTTFTLPNEAFTTCDYNAANTSVAAFRGGQTSQPALRAVVVECEPSVDSLPGVGTGSPERANGAEMLVISLVLFSLGAALLKARWVWRTRRPGAS